MREGRTKVSHRFPHRIVQKYTAATDAAVQLRGDVVRLALYPVGIVFPGLEQRRHIGGVNCEDIDQNGLQRAD